MNYLRTWCLGFTVGTLVLAGCGPSDDPEDVGQFSRIPDSCKLITELTVTKLLGGPSVGIDDPSMSVAGESLCSWEYADDDVVAEHSGPGVKPTVQRLNVRLVYYSQEKTQGALTPVEMARQVFDDLRKNLGPRGKTTVNGIGDKAYVDTGEGYSSVSFLKSNVQAKVTYGGRGWDGKTGRALDGDRLERGATEAAREMDGKLSAMR